MKYWMHSVSGGTWYPHDVIGDVGLDHLERRRRHLPGFSTVQVLFSSFHNLCPSISQNVLTAFHLMQCKC